MADAKQKIVHLHPGELVERAERLVHEQEPRAVHQRATQRDALLHSPGELMRPRREKAAQPHQLQKLVGVAARRGIVLPQDLHRKQHIVEHIAPRHQARRLEHEAVVAHRLGDLAAGDCDRAGGLRDQPADDAQQRGFAATAWPQKRDELAFLELERGVVQGDDGLKRGPADLVELEHLAHVLDDPERHQRAR